MTEEQKNAAALQAHFDLLCFQWTEQLKLQAVKAELDFQLEMQILRKHRELVEYNARTFKKTL